MGSMAEKAGQSLLPVRTVEILVVVDNYADTMLASTPGVRRPPMGVDGRLPKDTLLAEHGLCLLITAEKNGRQARILLDAGYSPVAAPRNLQQIGETGEDVEAIVISHGHEDHVGALLPLWRWAGRPPVILHPTAFQLDRFYRSDDGTMYELPQMLKRGNLRKKGVRVVESSGPSVLDSGYFLVTGEIPRVTDFERGLPGSIMVVNGKEVPDTVPEDQAVVVDVEGRGLVVVSGCAHAGIINTIGYARTLTGGRPVHAVVGGFHLAGDPFRAALQPTIEAIRAEKPALVVPMHCTGVKAKEIFRREMAGVNAESAVGTRFQLPR